ncbi:Formin-like protein 6 [Diplonema papillatum]|nr:Formin-like protein 6 [Diplonema papillatum]
MTAILGRWLRTRRKEDEAVSGQLALAETWNDDKRELMRAFTTSNARLFLYTNSGLTKGVTLKTKDMELDKPYYTNRGNKVVRITEWLITLCDVELPMQTTDTSSHVSPTRRISLGASQGTPTKMGSVCFNDVASPDARSGWRLSAVDAIDAILQGFKPTLTLDKGIPFRLTQMSSRKLIKGVLEFADGIHHSCDVPGISLTVKRNGDVVFVNGKDFLVDPDKQPTFDSPEARDADEEYPVLVLEWRRKDGSAVRRASADGAAAEYGQAPSIRQPSALRGVCGLVPEEVVSEHESEVCGWSDDETDISSSEEDPAAPQATPNLLPHQTPVLPVTPQQQQQLLAVAASNFKLNAKPAAPPPPPALRYHHHHHRHRHPLPCVPGGSAPPAAAGRRRPPPPPPPPPGAPPPPLPGGGGAAPQKAGAKLKRFYWGKVHQNRCGEGTFWGAKPGDDAVLPIDFGELTELFSVSKAVRKQAREAKTKTKQETVLPPKRAQNIGIVLSRLKLAPLALKDAFLSMDTDVLDADSLSSLYAVIPLEDEVVKVKEAQAKGIPLGTAEQYVDAMSSIPNLIGRIESWMFLLEFSSMAKTVREQIHSVSRATELLRTSDKLLAIMHTVLALGNHLNSGTAQGNASGFTVENLTKLRSVKSADNKISVLRFIVEVAHEHRQDLLAFSELKPAVEAASMISVSQLSSLLKDIEVGTEQVRSASTDKNSVPNGDEFGRYVAKKLKVCEAEVESLRKAFSDAQKQLLFLCSYFGEDQGAFDERAFFAFFAAFFADFEEEVTAHEGRVRRKQKAEERAAREAAKEEEKEKDKQREQEKAKEADSPHNQRLCERDRRRRELVRSKHDAHESESPEKCDDW